MPRSHANRGKSFERNINRSNITYENKGWAFVEKAEPPVKVKSWRGRYFLGWFERYGFVDYFGISNGRAICFEAKSTKSRTSFPLSNIKPEQVKTLRKWKDQGGISFVLVEFEKHFEVYFLKVNDLLEFWEAAQEGGKKSIPHEWFVINCDLVKSRRGVILDYLHCIQLP
jgi:recombination protein U